MTAPIQQSQLRSPSRSESQVGSVQKTGGGQEAGGAKIGKFTLRKRSSHPEWESSNNRPVDQNIATRELLEKGWTWAEWEAEFGEGNA